MQIKYNSHFTRKTSIKKKILIFVIFFMLGLLLLSKFNFPAPNQEIKKNIINEIIKLK